MDAIDPPIGRDGHMLLQRARVFFANHGKPYPVVYDSDKRGAAKAVEGGYAEFSEPDFVLLTPKGESYIDKLMRCN